MNKVKFNLKNVHIAVQQESTGQITYDVPFRLPGAVALNLEAKGEIDPFYADGVEYYTAISNSGYEGDLEIALLTDEFREKILGEKLDAKKVMIERQEVTNVPFAFGFEIDGNEKGNKYWFYGCKASRPNTASKTNEGSKTPQTDSLKLTCPGAPVIKGKDEYIIRSKTSGTTEESELKTWFDKVYIPTESLPAKV